MKKVISYACVLLCLLGSSSLMATDGPHPIAEEISRYQKEFQKLDNSPLLQLLPSQDAARYDVQTELTTATFLQLSEEEVAKLRVQTPQLLQLQITTPAGEMLQLQLYKANIFSDAFQVTLASQPDRAYAYEAGMYYWGTVVGQEHSLAAFAITEDEMMGFVTVEGTEYSLGKIKDNAAGVHVFYENKELKTPPALSCFADDATQNTGNSKPDQPNVYQEKDANNCVRMYIEVDYNVYQNKGGVVQAANYVNGAFSQVAILYANESINLVVNELFVWDVPDPYTGPSSGDYLNQFRNHLNGNFNGDLAHLVGFGGGGGIAYLDVLCGNSFRVAYSGVGATYNNVPTYSWTVMVLTHEIGHNLGSPHTHACAWNGNNTAIDGCGTQAGSGGCNAPLPAAGTIMSYCHLFGSVGIDLALGFGPQPGNLIRNKVYNANCLSSCSVNTLADAGVTEVIQPQAALCEGSLSPQVILKNFGSTVLTSADISYAVDGQTLGVISWTGDLGPDASTTVTLPTILLTNGSHTFTASSSNPNGGSDNNPANDDSSANYSFDDADGDSICDAQDICPGGNDKVDSNGNGIPDDCDCANNSQDFPVNPLTHIGVGTSQTSVVLPANSSDAFFSVSGLGALMVGRPDDRFREEITITYVNGSGFTQVYGVFDGSQVAAVDVNISGSVQSITVSLTDAHDGNTNKQLEVDLSVVYYCGTGTGGGGGGGGGGGCQDDDNDGICNTDDICPGFDDTLIGQACNDGDPCTVNDVYTPNCDCAGIYLDSDNDGVCDNDDICPGGDDTIDSNGNGVPDDCDSNDGCNNPVDVDFAPNPLTHSGTGASAASVSLPGASADVSFTISNLNARLGGRPQLRFDEAVTVTYVTGSGQTVTYGTFQGSSQSSVDVTIAGSVQSIQIALSDAYDGNAPSLSVNMSAVTACADGAATGQTLTGNVTKNFVRLYPNPTQDYAMLAVDARAETTQVIVRDLLGQTVARYTLQEQAFLRLPVSEWAQNNQVFLVTVYVDGEEPITKRLIVNR